MQVDARPFPNSDALGIDNDSWVVIKQIDLKRLILEAFGDDDKKNILIVVSEKPMIISDILDVCRIAHTSGYRKVKSLIKVGLLVSPDEIDQNGKMTRRYSSIIENLKIGIKKNRVIVKVMFSKTFMKCSHTQLKETAFAQAE